MGSFLHARFLVEVPAQAWRMLGQPSVALAGPETHLVFEEGVGPVHVTVRAEGGQPTFAQLAAAQRPEVGPVPPSVRELAAVLSLQKADVGGEGLVPQAVSCGVTFLFVPVPDRGVLARVRRWPEAWRASVAAYWAPHLYVLCLDPEGPG